MSRILKVESDLNKDLDAIEQGVEVIVKGGIVAYPTETYYGLGVNAYDEKAVKKIFEIKGRSLKKPILVIIGDRDQLFELIEKPPLHLEKLIDRFWPGPLTIILRASPKLPDILLGDTGKIGIRISSHIVARNLSLRANFPITSTSANISGKQILTNALDIMREWGNRIDLILDGGTLKNSRGSTIIDISENHLLLIREGDTPFKDIEDVLH